MQLGFKRLMHTVLIFLFSITIFSIASAQFDEVNALVQARRYSEAVNQLEALARATKDVAVQSWCYYQIGEIYYNSTQQYAGALEAYDKILRLEKKGLAKAELFLAFIKKGDVYSRVGRYEDAIQTYRTLVRLAPPTHFVHKTGLQKIRDIQNALADLHVQQKIVQTYHGTPLAALAQFQIAELYRNHSQLNRPEQAVVAYEALLRAHPDAMNAPEAQWRIAHLRHTVLNQLPLAMEAYQTVADTYPTSNFAAEALFQIANIRRTAEEYPQAIAVFETLKQKYPNFWNMHAVLYWVGGCYEKNMNYPKAVEAFKTFLHAYLPHLDPGYLGQISMYDKSISEVKAQIRTKIEKLDEQMAAVESERLKRAIAAENFAEALTIARHLIATEPNTAYAKQAAAQLRSIEHRATIQNLRAQVQDETLSPAETARAQLQIGTIYERQLQDYPRVIQAYREVIKGHPDSAYAAEALYRIGLVYAEQLASPNEAIQAYKTVIARHPNALQAMMANFQLGELYRKLQRYNEALQAYQTTIGYPERDRYLAGGYKDSFADRAQFRIGRVHYDDRRYTDARFAFEEFIQSRTQSPRLAAAYIYLAVIYQEQAENARAVEFYEKAEALLTDNPVQMGMLIDEAGTLGFQATDADGVIRFLQEHQKRLGTE